MSEHHPKVSFGVPVRNEEGCVRSCLDSILKQDFGDFEVVVCDNASTDGTRDILQDFAARDSRIRLFLNDEDIGQIENCNRVFRLSRGEYFRWLGASDWLDPRYASHCVAALDKDPGAVAVTTYFRIHKDGRIKYEEYQGELLESERPERRFARMLWTFHAGDTVYDPCYSMMRRDVLARTGLLRMMARADAMLAAELSLLGRFQHVPVCLADRRKEHVDRATVIRRYHPQRYREMHESPWQQLRVLLSITWAAELTMRGRFACGLSVIRYFSKEVYRRSNWALHRYWSKWKQLIRSYSRTTCTLSDSDE